MNIDDMILVSVDDHVVEPENLFEGRLSAKYQDRAPRIVERPNGVKVWAFEGDEIEFHNSAHAGTTNKSGELITGFESMRRGCWDIHERVMDMNANGELAAMGFPSFPRFCGQLFSAIDDKGLALEVVRAYNDWHIDEWCGSYPGRFIPLAVTALWDAELAAAEVRRVAAKGCRAITFSENPSKLGYPSLYSRSWDPLWQACSDEGVVVCMHLGSSSQLLVTAPDAPIEATISLVFAGPAQAAVDLVWSQMFSRFPGLTVALSEGGIGWIPYVLERIDYVYEHTLSKRERVFGDTLPSQLFNEHVVSCFVEDVFGVASRDYLNMDMITWESDYPHPDGTWPNSPEHAMQAFAGLTDDEIDKLSHANALRIFQFDPFKHIPREQATVGALRALAENHDITPREYPRLKGDIHAVAGGVAGNSV